MTDLVQRMRKIQCCDPVIDGKIGAAIDRIETLLAARTDLCERIEDLEEALRDSSHWLGKANERIDELEAALRVIAGRRCYGTEDCRNIARRAIEGKS